MPEMRLATPSILAILFIILNLYEPCSARSIHISSSLNSENQDVEASEEHPLLNPHIRQKRGLFSLLSKGLTIASWTSYGVSMSATVYHAIRKCEDYRPSPCKDPTCEYLSPCPDFLCQSPEKNKDYVDQQKVATKAALDEIDSLLLDAFQIEVNGEIASIKVEAILNSINSIYGNVDILANSFVSVDDPLSEKFQERSLEIQAMVNDKRTTIDNIVTSPLMQGIFDKWTWDGTGRFVFSVALTIGYGLYGPLKQRYAINKLYKEMKADFQNKFDPNSLAQAKIHNKIVYVEGMTATEIKSQLKKAAKAAVKVEQAHKTQGFVTKVIGPIVNGLYTALSIWSVYTQIDECKTITNDMQDTALNITGTRDEIEGIKVTKVLPLFDDIYDRTWKPVKDILTNDTILDLLEGIRNLTLEANFTDTSDADTIKNFLDNIHSATFTPSGITTLESDLTKALKSIDLQFKCNANKLHAIATVINDCKSGRDTLKVLHGEADSTYYLNSPECLDKITPYTSVEELQTIISSVAKEKGWYDNCPLNDEDLLYRVCSEKEKGYIKPADIVAQVNKTILTEAMIPSFLTRCLPAEITPKRKEDTCKLYCLYQPTEIIVKHTGLLESQVKEIIPSCGICTVTASDKTEICHSYFCKGFSAANVEQTMKLPLPTVNDVINNCVQKCAMKESEKQEVCEQLKCKQSSSDTVASVLNLPVSSIDELKSQCDSIVQQCAVSDQDRGYILALHCYVNFSATQIQQRLSNLQLEDIENVIKSEKCEDFLQQ